MNPTRSRHAAVLILVVGMIAILATIATAFLAQSRSTASIGEDAVRLAQTRIMLNAALSYIREASRLGYAEVDADGLLIDAREAWGWIDTRVVVPAGGTRIGPNATDGSALWTSRGVWPGPGGVIRAPMYRMLRPPLAISQDYVRNPIPTDLSKPTFGIPFLTNPDPVPLLPQGSFFDIGDPTPTGRTVSSLPPPSPVADARNSQARKVWVMGDRSPVPGSADLAWFRIYREDIELTIDAAGRPKVQHTAAERVANEIPDQAGPCTFIVTVGAGGSRGYQDWDEVRSANDEASFGGSPELFEEMVRHEQRQWFRIGWSASVGGGEDLIQAPAIEHDPDLTVREQGPQRSQYEGIPLNVSRWRADEFVSPSQPRNYGGTISFIQRLARPPANW